VSEEVEGVEGRVVVAMAAVNVKVGHTTYRNTRGSNPATLCDNSA